MADASPAPRFQKTVSPAKAGVHHPDPELRPAWIPAFAGITENQYKPR